MVRGFWLLPRLQLAVGFAQFIVPVVIQGDDVYRRFHRATVEPNATGNDLQCHTGLTPELSRAEGVGLND